MHSRGHGTAVHQRGQGRPRVQAADPLLRSGRHEPEGILLRRRPAAHHQRRHRLSAPLKGINLTPSHL